MALFLKIKWWYDNEFYSTFSKLIKNELVFKWLLSQTKIAAKTFSDAMQANTYIIVLINTGKTKIGLKKHKLYQIILIETEVIFPRLL